MSTRCRAWHALALVALSAGACTHETPLQVTSTTIVVHAVLNALYDEQVVAVQETADGVPFLTTPADSATVTITGPDGVAMTAVEVPDSLFTRVYQVSLSAFHEQLVPGGTYRLHVLLKSGEEITGTTTIPDASPVVPPVAILPFNEATDTLRLNWQPVSGAASYEVRIQSAAGVYALFTDTSVALPGTLRSLEGKVVFADGLDHQAIVSAVDQAYYQYYRTSSDEFTGATARETSPVRRAYSDRSWWWTCGRFTWRRRCIDGSPRCQRNAHAAPRIRA